MIRRDGRFDCRPNAMSPVHTIIIIYKLFKVTRAMKEFEKKKKNLFYPKLSSVYTEKTIKYWQLCVTGVATATRKNWHQYCRYRTHSSFPQLSQLWRAGMLRQLPLLRIAVMSPAPTSFGYFSTAITHVFSTLPVRLQRLLLSCGRNWSVLAH